MVNNIREIDGFGIAINDEEYYCCKLCDEWVHRSRLYNPANVEHTVCARCITEYTQGAI